MHTNIVCRFAAVLLICCFTAGLAKAADVTISWTFDASPTATCSDGVSLAATYCPATGFELQKLEASTWTVLPDVIAAAARSKVLANIPPGNRCYRLRTNSNGLFSDSTSQACVTVPSLPPKAPQGIVVTVVVVATP